MRKIISSIMLAALLTTAAVASPRVKRCERCEAIVAIAATSCKNASKKVDHRPLLNKLIEIEVRAGVPDEYRGAVLAAACRESGFRANPRKGDRGRAVGLLQMWPWWERSFKIKRTDPLASARAWTAQIMKSVRKARRRCGRKMAFRAAWAWVASGPKGWRCRSPRHYSLLRRWKRRARWYRPVPPTYDVGVPRMRLK